MAHPRFRVAVVALDGGDLPELERLIAADPALVRERLDEPSEGYFREPYLLWFVAENPIRHGTLPANIVEITRALVRAVEAHAPESAAAQIAYALALVCSGRVVREQGVQLALLDVLVDAGAGPDGALVAALAHRELEAARRLLERGARWTLAAAAALGRDDELARLAPTATAEEKQLALAAAAHNGQARALAALIALGLDLDAFAPVGFHPHATPLHLAVDSGSLESVKVLVDAGAARSIPDRGFGGTALGWAEHEGRDEIAAFLRAR